MSEKTGEKLYASDFFDGESTPLRPEQRIREGVGLWICQDPDDPRYGCGGEMVYPWDWSEEGHRHWRIVLRCPECESCREGVFTQDQVMKLDDQLDIASSALLGDLRKMTFLNMSEEADFISKALDFDLIVPDDFGI